jgi:hypothetical protein
MHACIGFLQALMGLMLEILQTLHFFNPNPLVISLQLMEKFHNWVKCGQWTMCTSECCCTAALDSSTTSGGPIVTNVSTSIYQTNAKNYHYTT